MRQTHPHFRSETWNVTKTITCNWTGTSEVAFKAFRFIYFLHLRIKSQYQYSVGVECTVVQLFASMSAWVQEFGHRGLAILFLGPEGHFDKLDRLEWYQDSEEELLIVPLRVLSKEHLCVFVRMWKFECGLLLHLWLCITASGWIAAATTRLFPSNVVRFAVFRWTCSCSNFPSWRVLYTSQSW